MNVLRKWDPENKEVLDKCIKEVITRVEEIDDNIGIIAAQDIVDIVTENLGPEIYNKAIKDVKKLLSDRVQDVEADIDLLQVTG